jgi:hypothetical protein
MSASATDTATAYEQLNQHCPRPMHTSNTKTGTELGYDVENQQAYVQLLDEVHLWIG